MTVAQINYALNTTEKRFKNGYILTMTISPYYYGHMTVIRNDLFYNTCPGSSGYGRRFTTARSQVQMK